MSSFEFKDGVLHLPGWIIIAPVTVLLVLGACYTATIFPKLYGKFTLLTNVILWGTVLFSFWGLVLCIYAVLKVEWVARFLNPFNSPDTSVAMAFLVVGSMGFMVFCLSVSADTKARAEMPPGIVDVQLTRSAGK